MMSRSFLSTNVSLPNPALNIYQILQKCMHSTTGTSIHVAFTVTCLLLLLPLCVFVFYLGHRQSRQHGSGLKTSHTDVFTYHMVVIEFISIFGTTLVCCSLYVDLKVLGVIGIYFYTINLPGQMLFHILTCLERFLAVVHPITYRSLRTAKGIRLRNITLTCAWLLTFSWTVLLITADQLTISIASFCLNFSFLIVVSFCSLSVLCVLSHMGPGKERRVDRSKMRALYTILAILGVLLFRFGGSMLSTMLFACHRLVGEGMCALWMCVVWFFLPSRFVLPMLFLQRAGKLSCSKRNDSG